MNAPAAPRKPVPLHADVRPPRPASPGHVAKRDNEYRRGGTANIFGVVEPKAGRHFTCVTPNWDAAAFARMTLIAAYPAARTSHLVVDNLNTYREKALTDHFGVAEEQRLWRRLTVHDTPKHGSWLNQAEIELSLVARQCLGTRRLETIDRLRTEVQVWTRRANHRKTTIGWRFTGKRPAESSATKSHSLSGHRLRAIQERCTVHRSLGRRAGHIESGRHRRRSEILPCRASSAFEPATP